MRGGPLLRRHGPTIVTVEVAVLFQLTSVGADPALQVGLAIAGALAAGIVSMRQRDDHSLALALQRPDDLAERDPADESLDRELTNGEEDVRPDERDLLLEPWSAVRDLGRAGFAISCPTRRLSRKAFRDRRAIRKVILIDARAGEPAPAARRQRDRRTAFRS